MVTSGSFRTRLEGPVRTRHTRATLNMLPSMSLTWRLILSFHLWPEERHYSAHAEQLSAPTRCPMRANWRAVRAASEIAARRRTGRTGPQRGQRHNRSCGSGKCRFIRRERRVSELGAGGPKRHLFLAFSVRNGPAALPNGTRHRPRTCGLFESARNSNHTSQGRSARSAMRRHRPRRNTAFGGPQTKQQPNFMQFNVRRHRFALPLPLR